MEDNFNAVLSCDDKEQLRRKLSLLQKEYLRTAQRLQRAERSETVRRHVRSRISQQNQERDEGQASSALYPASSPLTLGSPGRALPGSAPGLGHVGGSSVGQKRTPSVRFLLPAGGTCSSTPDPGQTQGPLLSPAPRLRSRRSSLRLEGREEKRGEAGETEQLLSCSESESPSLLMSHCDTDTLPGRREGGAVEGDEGGIGKEEIKQGKREGREERTVLNSCTLVEGLLFPVEYYVRTTRRMTSSQSQPDLHAVILSQLSRGRKRARPTTHTIHTHSVTLGTHTHSSQGTDGDHVTSELASNQRPPEASATHHMPARESVTNEDACLVSKGHIAAPMRGCLKSRKWRRGNRKGRGLGGSLSLDLLEVVAPDRPQHPAGPGPASQPLPGAPGREGQPLSGGPETKVYPIFRTSSPLQNRGSVSSLGERHAGSLTRVLTTFDLQDFYLPDDQFGKLKLEKLQRIVVETQEPFAASPYSTRRRHLGNHICDDDWYQVAVATAEPLSLSLTPSVMDSAPPLKEHSSIDQPEQSVGQQSEETCEIDKPLGQPEVIPTVDYQSQGPKSVMNCKSEDEHRDQSVAHQSDAQPIDQEIVECPSECPAPQHGPSQFLLSPSLTTPIQTDHTPSVQSSLHLPLLGLTPLLSPSSLPYLGPPTQALSPPPLSPRPSDSPVSPLLRLTPPHLNRLDDRTPPPAPDSLGGEEEEERMEGVVLRRTHTLKAPAGDSVVDACCVSWPTGEMCVAVAGESSVCVWSVCVCRTHTPPTWLHTWNFTEPVISVFPVLDVAGLLCVTLGELEVRETRVLSCGLSQVLLSKEAGQVVVGVSRGRVVSSSHSAAPLIQVFSLLQDGRVQSTQPLVSPGACVRALAAVEGQEDALIGSTDDGHLVLWNMRTGQLLQRMLLQQSLTQTICLRGYSSRQGVLFVLLQHTYHSSLEEREEKGGEREEERGEREEDRKGERRGELFSLLATNPVIGGSAVVSGLELPGACSAVVSGLELPGACSGRLLEVDVLGSRVLYVTQRSGGGAWVCVCVGAGGSSRGGHGGKNTLLMSHPNGDLSIYHYRPQST
ncbi:partner and localizer of BRCA2 [Hypomesus transpacificus]|uniref:partner and localizer of BRCA2 n=1 Tax=Hypomesus transpacificus TaxID=137520 RepID=UPI001F086736|nr:partner and localizer of BRCA2 [Hypomesus transpacificus]